MKSTVLNQQNVEYVAFVIPFFDLYNAYFYRANSNDLTSYIDALKVKLPCGVVAKILSEVFGKEFLFFTDTKTKGTQ